MKEISIVMKKIALLLSAFVSAAALYGAEALWDGNLGKVSLREGAKLKEVSVKTDENGLLDVNAKSEGDSVTYVCIQVDVTPFKLDGKLLSLKAWTDTPKETTGFYVRALSANNRKVMSYMSWNFLSDKAQTINLIPGVRVGGLAWEANEVNAPIDTEIAKLWIYIGTRGDGKAMNLHVGDFQLVAPRLKSDGPGSATLEDGVITAQAKMPADTKENAVTYFRFETPFAGDITGKSLKLTASTGTPKENGAFYVRGYNAANECILSFMSWNNQLKDTPREFVLTPGKNSSGLTWEAGMVKAGAKPELAKLEFYLGTRGNAGKEINGKIEKISLGE